MSTSAVGATSALGPYVLQGELGRGGMGVVYRAIDQRLGRTVALKVVQPDVAAAAGISMQELKSKLRQEAQLAARVSHPNVVTVFAFEEIGENAVIAMELVEGPTLHDVLAGGARWTLQQAAHLIEQAADGVAAAHAIGIVHRDLKPGNLMLTPDGRVKVLDFGIAKATSVDASAAISRVTFGTVQYMAPEQVLGRPVSTATDVWALGVILYEVLVGASAFGDGAAVTIGMRVAGEEPPFLADDAIGSQTFGSLYPVLRAALVKQPAQRLSTAAHLRDALKSMIGGPASGPWSQTAMPDVPAPPIGPTSTPKPTPPLVVTPSPPAPQSDPQPAPPSQPAVPPTSAPRSAPQPVPAGFDRSTGPQLAKPRVQLIGGALAATVLLVFGGVWMALPGESSGGGVGVLAPPDSVSKATVDSGSVAGSSEGNPGNGDSKSLPSMPTPTVRPPGPGSESPTTPANPPAAAVSPAQSATAAAAPESPLPAEIRVYGEDGGNFKVTQGVPRTFEAFGVDARGSRIPGPDGEPQINSVGAVNVTARLMGNGLYEVTGQRTGEGRLVLTLTRREGEPLTRDVRVLVLEPAPPASVRNQSPPPPVAPPCIPSAEEVVAAWKNSAAYSALQEKKRPTWAEDFSDAREIIGSEITGAQVNSNGRFTFRVKIRYKRRAMTNEYVAEYLVEGASRIEGGATRIDSLRYASVSR